MNVRSLLALGLAWAICTVSAVGQVSITSFFPKYGSPGEMVTITGNNFSPGTVSVWFNGVKSTLAQATTFSTIQAQIPAGATTGPISVKVGSAAAVSSLEDFTVIGVGPYITGFYQDSGFVYIEGAHFTTVTNAYFDGKKGLEFFVMTDGSIRVKPPLNVTTGPISVRSRLGTNTTTALFYVPPVIKTVSPLSGRAGTNVFISGTNFLGTIAVLFNEVNAEFTVTNNFSIGVKIPPSARSGKLRVNAPAGSVEITNMVVLPTLFGFTPGFGAPGSSVTITGANFEGGTPVVRFNGAQASVTNLTVTNLTAVVPASATTGPISIQTTAGSFTNMNPFYVTAGVTSFSPTNSPPGSSVRITGINFLGATAVNFGGVPAASFVVTNNTTIGAVVPAGVITGPISITTPAGTVTSAARFYGPATITSFSPTHGLPGTNVFIVGTNLLGATAVRFNGLNASTFTATNNGYIYATVPAGAQPGPISVVTPAGTNVSAESFLLDYVDLALSLRVYPEYLFAGSNSTWIFTVTNKGSVDAPSARFTNTIPNSVMLLSMTTSKGTLSTNNGQYIANFGTIAAHSSATVVQQVLPTAVSEITILGGATAGYPEMTPADNVVAVTMTVHPAAVLSIRRLTNQVRISWPLSLSDLVLQHKFDLSSTSPWVNTPLPKTTTATENVVVDTNNVSQKFYRLDSGS